MGANESPYGPSPLALEAMRASAALGHLYNDPEGYELRAEISARSGAPIQQVVIGAGIDDLLMLLCRTFLDPGDSVVMSLGGYPTFGYAVSSVGGEFLKAPYREDKNDLDALAELANTYRPKLVYLSNPDNPSGSWYSASKIAAFRKSLPDGSVLLLDEAYADFAPELPEFSVDDPEVVRMRTFSKAYGMAGLRVGYGIVPEDVAASFNKHRPHFGVNRIAQAGALASLMDSDWIPSLVAMTETARETLGQIALAAGLNPLESYTNFVAMDCGSRTRAEAILAALAARDVFIRKPAIAPLDRCIRVTVALPANLERFGEILAEVVR
jgi:histidinol-phosphate aminotransferase